ncbi:NAD(P)-dependent oxidoreductase [Occultella aeris]|uniref:2-hydroxy-3-oxopropionate reductase n=1 Tax=Occultella aeris TaxID=2761496 RepID=A0A7M4DNB5_9MICO|nr:NAD(P)-binding domain-containing protein [Occultella aeris]VZO38927.1 2-hydroxy-3-oxopropionate reductase [Occultella aeris]
MTTNSQVTVLGLGEMGSALARTLVDRGYRTTVWNRTATKAAPLAATGAGVAATAVEAVAASPLVIVCLLDSAAVDAVLPRIESSVSGKVLVNVTSGSPVQARANADWARERGAQYLDGGIMGDPTYVGTPSVMFSFSGDRGAFEAHESTLQALGAIAYYGEDAGLAAVEFLAQVAVGYEFLIGLLHTFRLVRAEGVDVAKFAQRVAASIGGYVPLVNAFGTAVADGEYAPDLGSLDVQAALMDDLISHRESLGIDAVRMREVKILMDRRIADGHGDQGFSSLFELLRASGRSSPTSTSGWEQAESTEDRGRTPSASPH